MDFVDRINELAAGIKKQQEHTLMEEAVQYAFVFPFLSAIGYSVSNPTAVFPKWMLFFPMAVLPH